MFDCSCGITPTRADICFTAALRSVLAGCYTQVPHRSTLYRQNPPSLRPFPQIFPGTIYFIFFCTRMCIDGISATGVFSPNDLRPKTYISLDILVPVDRSDMTAKTKERSSASAGWLHIYGVFKIPDFTFRSAFFSYTPITRSTLSASLRSLIVPRTLPYAR